MDGTVLVGYESGMKCRGRGTLFHSLNPDVTELPQKVSLFEIQNIFEADF